MKNIKDRMKNCKINFKNFARKRKKALIISFFNVIVLLFLGYLLNNQAIFTGEDLNKYAWMEWIKESLGISEKIREKEDALFVNVAYDKQLIERHDLFGMTIGNVDITDRSKLLLFLQMLKNTNTYKYIFMDIRFEKGFDSPIDTELFSQIINMRDIVVANHSDIELIDKSLSPKVALNDYRTTIIDSSFTRYEYLKDGQISVPLFAYKELTGNTIDKHFLFYTSNHRLCYKSLFIKSPIEDWSEFNEQNNKVYYNLGNDLLGNYSEEDIAILTNGKYVVIGDMVEDIHDTYSGSKPGSVLTYYSFVALKNGEHYVHYALLIILAFIYFFISLGLFERSSITERIPFVKKSHSKIVHFCTSFIGYTTVLLIVMIFLNMIFGIATSILVPSVYFSIQENFIKYKNQQI